MPATTYLQRGQARAAARAQAIAGQALRLWGRHAEARDQLTAAVEVLRADPDTDTVRALEELAALEVFAGSPDADRLTTEALILGQALGVGAEPARWPAHSPAGSTSAAPGGAPKRSPTSAKARGSPPGRRQPRLGRALLNLSDALAVTDPAAARRGCPHRRRAPAPGRRPGLPGVCDRQPGPGTADARRLGRCRGGAHPGRGLRRAGGQRAPRLLPGLAGGAARRRRHRRDHAGRRCGTCGPAKIPRTSR